MIDPTYAPHVYTRRRTWRRWRERERENERMRVVQFVSSENARIIRFPMFEREKLQFEKMEFRNELGNLPFSFGIRLFRTFDRVLW